MNDIFQVLKENNCQPRWLYPAIALLGIHMKEYLMLLAHSSLPQHIHNSQTMELVWVSTDWGIDRENVIHTYTYIQTVKYYSAIKKEWNYTICRKMDRSRNNHVKWNKPNWERQILCVLSYVNLDHKSKNKWQKPNVNREVIGSGNTQNERGWHGGWICTKYLIDMYENSIMKHVKIVLKGGW
jgi:hypothetical protein